MQLGGISWDTFTRTGNALGIPSVDQLHSPAAWLPKIGRFASQQAGFYVKGVRLSNFTVMKLPETQHISAPLEAGGLFNPWYEV